MSKCIVFLRWSCSFLQSEAGGGSEEGTSSGGAHCEGSEKGSSRIDEEEAELNLLDDETSSSHTKADYTPAQSVSCLYPLRACTVCLCKVGFVNFLPHSTSHCVTYEQI